MGYMNHAINQSATIYGEAASALTAPAMKAVAFDSYGKIILPANSGDAAIGIVLADAADIATGGRVNIQIKDICYALAGETIKRGYNLKAHTDGTLKQASAGDNIIGIALGDAASGKPVEVMIVHGCVPATKSSLALKLSDLSDVDLSTPPTDAQVLKYDNASSKWKAAADATE